MLSSSSSSSASSDKLKNTFSLPAKYIFEGILGYGSFGKVIACYDKHAGQRVAVKLARRNNEVMEEEVCIMKMLMVLQMDKFNIITFFDFFTEDDTIGLVFEKLDISLLDVVCDYPEMLKLQVIRTIIQQLAVALSALKSIGVIHTDLKLDNIMLVDHSSQHLKVKIIDFGLAKVRSELQSIDQTPSYCAPEVLFGLSLSEAIDIWSLGTLMAELLLLCLLFPGDTYYSVLVHMIDILGPPPDHLLNASQQATYYFIEQDEKWLLKTLEEMEMVENVCIQRRNYTFCSLDEMKMERREPDNETEATERSEYIELIKAMLQWDQMDRITPCGMLKHPFITKSFLNGSAQSKHCNTSEPSTSQYQPIPNKTTTQVEDRIIETLTPGVIKVKSADPFNRVHLEDAPDDNRKMNFATKPSTCPAQPASNKTTTEVEYSFTTKPSTCLAQLASIKTTTQVEDRMIETLPPGVITVKSADPFNRNHLGNTPYDHSDVRLSTIMSAAPLRGRRSGPSASILSYPLNPLLSEC